MVTCTKLIKRTLKECDFFGTLITFQINNDYDYKSVVGGISTILYSIIAGAYILYMSLRFILRKEVDFIYSNKILDSGPFVDLQSIGFNLAFGVRYSDSGYPAYNETLKFFDHYFYTVVREKHGDKQQKLIHTKRCEESDFPPEVTKSFYENELNEMLCPILEPTTNLSIDGLYTDEYYKYLIIETRLSAYGMSHLDEFIKFLEKDPLQSSLYFLDSAIDYSNRDNYLPSYINYIYKELDADYEKKTQVFISSIEFSNDENIIISNPSLKIDSMYDNSIDSFKFFHDRVSIGQNLIQKYVIKASPKIIQLSRTYQKLPSFIADLTGLLQNILELLLIFINIIERKAVDRKLIQKMLKFNGSKYYDVKYMNSIFQIDEMDNNIKNLINKEKLTISRNGNISTQRKSIANLLQEHKFLNLNNNNFENYTRNRNSRTSIRLITNRLLSENVLDEIKSEKEDESSHCKTIKEENDENLNNMNTSRNLKENEDINENNNKKNKNIPLLLLNDNNNSEKKSEEKSSNSNKNSDSFGIESISSYSSKKEKTFQTVVKNNFFPNHELEIINIKLKNKEFEEINEKKINNENKNNNNRETLSTLENNLNNKLESKTLLLNKDDDENLGKFSTFDVLRASYCYCCSRKQKRRNLMLKKCEYKIHYYLDIYTYIKKMQEIDLIKYCLFDENQMKLFKYLSTPPVKLSEKNIGIYKEFEEQQVNYSNIGKNEIDKLVDSYINIAKKKDITFEDIKLLRLVNAEVDYLE